MRILYDHQVFSLQDRGGISRYFFELFRHLPDLDCSVDVFAGANRNLFCLSELPKIRKWEYRGMLVPPAGKYRFILNELLANTILPFRGTFDVYHPTLYRNVPLARYRRMVVTHHDCAYERFPSLFHNAESIRQMRARLFAKADAIICPSASTRADLHEFYDVSEDKTFVVHHGVTRLASNSLAGAPGTAVLPGTGRPFLLYVGSRAAYKNFDGFLRAFAAADMKQDYEILVLGGGAATASEHQLLSTLLLHDSVKFVPSVSDEFLAQAYQRAHLFVYPSLYEGFGFPPLEAMSFDCPVLVARTSSLPEICGDAAFYFDPADETGFVNSLRVSCFNESQRLQNIERGKVLADRYTWEKCAANTFEVYALTPQLSAL